LGKGGKNKGGDTKKKPPKAAYGRPQNSHGSCMRRGTKIEGRQGKGVKKKREIRRVGS